MNRLLSAEIPQNALTYAIFRSKALSKVIHILECLYIFNIYRGGVCYEYTCNRLNCSCTSQCCICTLRMLAC